ncbi:hypothetical protein AAC387_Pa02g3857 [Persea americana]
MAGEGRQGKVVLIMGKGEELKKYEQKNKRGRKRKGEVMDQRKKVGDKKVKMSSGSTSGTAEVEKLEEKKVRKTRGSTATAVKESTRKWPVRERKVVDRFSFPPVRELASMFLFIKKGVGWIAGTRNEAQRHSKWIVSTERDFINCSFDFNGGV